jgi:outer membrane lipoprotein-sorting protein
MRLHQFFQLTAVESAHHGIFCHFCSEHARILKFLGDQALSGQHRPRPTLESPSPCLFGFLCLRLISSEGVYSVKNISNHVKRAKSAWQKMCPLIQPDHGMGRIGQGFFTIILIGMVLLTLGSSKPPAVSKITPGQLMFMAFENYEAIRSYQCRLILHATKGNTVQDSEYLFYYQKPNMIRMHVEKGIGEGDTIVMRSDGTIRGRREGILSMLAITLNPNDERLRDLWDRRFYDSDWGTILRETEKRMKECVSCRVELDGGAKRFVLTVEGADGYFDQTWLDGERLTVLKKHVRMANGDKLEATWTNIALNPTFEKDFFDF